MKNPYINLKNCKRGDLLVLKNGSLAKYLEHRPEQYFPHDIQYYDEFKSRGTRCDDDSDYKKNRKEFDFDVVLMFPAEMNTKQFRNQLSKNVNLKWEDVKYKYEKEEEGWFIEDTPLYQNLSKFVIIELEDRPKPEDFYEAKH